MIPAIILAAGRSARMGRSKALLVNPASGATFVATIVATLIEGGADDVLVVARPEDAALVDELDRIAGHVRIVENPQLAIDVSLAKMPRGYALAYRALPSPGVSVPQIRAHFLDRTGRIVGDSGIALAEPNGGQTALEIGTDGRMVVSWTDTTEDNVSTLRALILPCGG